jgi:serine O-acetyltransferase
MLKRLREDYWLYGRDAFNRALWAMAVYRFGQWVDGWRFAPARRLGNKVYGLVFAFTPLLTGVFLDRRTRIGRRFHIVHAGMVCISPNAVFGDDCGVMHGVTVGQNMHNPGVPRFGNNVFVGCHATVLGPITVGDGARIAANSLVFCDVPAGALAMGVPARIYPGMAKLTEPPKAEAPAALPAARASEFRGGQPPAVGQSMTATGGEISPSIATAPA